MEEDELTYLPSEDILEEYDLEDTAMHDSIDVETADEQDIDYDAVRHPGNPACASFTGHAPSEAYAVAFSGNVIISGGGDDQIFFFKISPSGISCVYSEKHNESVACIAVSGRMVASGCLDGTVRVYRIAEDDDDQTVQSLYQLEGISGEVMWMEWGNAYELAVGGEDGSVWIWNADVDAFSVKHVFSGNGQRTLCGAFSNDKSFLVCGHEQGSIFVYGMQDGSIKKRHNIPSSVLSVCVHPVLKIFVVGTEAGTVFQCPLLTGSPCALVGHSDSVESVSFSGNAFVTVSMDGIVNFLDDQKMVVRFSIPIESPISCMASSRHLGIVGCTDGRIHSIDLREGKILESFASNSAPALGAAFNSKGDQFAICSADGHITIYDI
jgi:WD40 repeat protein